MSTNNTRKLANDRPDSITTFLTSRPSCKNTGKDPFIFGRAGSGVGRFDEADTTGEGSSFGSTATLGMRCSDGPLDGVPGGNEGTGGGVSSSSRIGHGFREREIALVRSRF